MLDELRQALERVLGEISFLKLQTGRRAEGAVDWIVPVETQAGIYELGLLVIASAQPRQARSAAYQLHSWLAGRSDRAGILAAPYISPESAAILHQAGVGYLDLSGNCRLIFDHVHIQREQFPNRFAHRRATRTVFSPKAERILRVLLHDTRRAWNLDALAKDSRVSLGQAHNVLTFMQNQEWVRRDKQGLHLVQPDSLVREWARNYRRERSAQREYHSLTAIDETELSVARACEELGADYAFTGFSAGSRLAPMVRYQKISAYVSKDLDEVAKRAGLKPVSSGANVTLLAPYDEAILFGSSTIDGLKVVSPLQAYLDLHAAPGRGEEAAQAVYEQVLSKSW